MNRTRKMAQIAYRISLSKCVTTSFFPFSDSFIDSGNGHTSVFFVSKSLNLMYRVYNERYYVDRYRIGII